MPPSAATGHLLCLSCGMEWAEPRADFYCSCGRLLDLPMPDPPARGTTLRQLIDSRTNCGTGVEASGVWRYREFLPHGLAESAITFPEGNTPLIESGPVSSWAGVSSLRLKHEGLNPTGSFKDRGMAVGMTRAVLEGASTVLCASTGNTAASLSCYAARAELDAVVLVPAGGVAHGKLAQAAAYGAKVIAVRGDFDRCMRMVVESAQHLGMYLLNSVNPWRIAGQQTIILELLQQLAWRAPDWIVFPAGNLGNTAAFGRAAIAARDAGLIDRVPRLAAVQASGAAPFATSFEQGFAPLVPVDADTVASAIRIGNPASFDRAVDAIRATDGVVTSVADDEILEAKSVIDCAGVGCEAASAAAVAGVRKLRRENLVPDAAEVVAVLTGHLLKEPAAVAPPGVAHEIDGTMEELERALRER